ncbi:Uncharacterised protein [Mycobacteroides abscessus subsp. abscessus]|nr:Uncharacterised protein [Mycobacteroides abscessus subsp. abscessus]
MTGARYQVGVDEGVCDSVDLCDAAYLHVGTTRQIQETVAVLRGHTGEYS